MALKDCLYTLEDHPELLEAFKADLQDGTTHFPGYIKTVMKNLSADKKDIQLGALGIKRGIGHIEDYVKRTKGEFGKRLGVKISAEAANDRAYSRAIENLVVTRYELGGRKSGVASIEAESLAFKAKFQAGIAEMMEAYKARKFGFAHSTQAQEQLLHGMYGSTTDVDAKSYAKMLTKTLEEVRQIRNSFGGRVEKLDTYRLPQSSNAALVTKMGEDQWTKLVKSTVDQGELIKQVQQTLGLSPSKQPTTKAIDSTLSELYRTISTDGASSIVPRGTTSGLRGNISKRHTEHRFLHFKDADSWLKYNKLAGSETPYAAITNHIDQMSREIAAMKMLGPHPEKTLTYLMSYVDKRLLKRGSAANAHQLYKTVMGELDGIPHPKMAAAFGSARNIMVGVKLGKAQLTALSDNYFLGRMAKLADIPVYKMFTRLAKELTPGNSKSRMFAGQIGLGADYAVDKLVALNRLGMSDNNNWTAKFADASVRLTGLNYWTQAVESTFKLEFAQQLGNKLGKSFDELGRLKDMMEAYGITAKDWGVLRNTPLTSYKNSKYFDVTAIKDLDVMAKVQGMILSETPMAAPRPTARVQAAVHGSSSASSAVGIARRTIFQFKGFPLSIMMNQWAREFSHNTMASKTLGLGSMIVGATLLGAISYNMKQVSDGKTALDWDSPELMFKGFMQGGALALVGDGLFLDPDMPGGIPDLLAGPVLGEAGNFLRDFVTKPMKDIYEMNGKATEHMAKAAVSTVKRNLPTPLNLPLVKTAVVRATLDQLDKQVNPDWASRNRQLRRRLKRDKGQTQWWKPGEFTPDF